MWKLKCTILPVIIGATGIVTRSLRKHFEPVPGKHFINSLQKTAILGTSHIIRKVLQCEAWSLSGGDHCWLKRCTRQKKPVTRGIHNNNNNNNNNKSTSICSHYPTLAKSRYIFMYWANKQSIKQRSSYFPKIMGSPQNCRRQRSDMRQVPHWNPTSTGRHRIKISRPRYLTRGMC